MNCVCSPSQVTLNSSNYDSGLPIAVTLADNNIDEGTNQEAYDCKLYHEVTSDDAVYKNLAASHFTISALNDDDADAKLQLTKDGGGFEFRLKVVGPFTITEGENVTYDVVLDTCPNATVLVGLDVKALGENTPLFVTHHPPFLVFLPDEWNVTKSVVLSTPNDNIDNDMDIERFHVDRKMGCYYKRLELLSPLTCQTPGFLPTLRYSQYLLVLTSPKLQ